MRELTKAGEVKSPLRTRTNDRQNFQATGVCVLSRQRRHNLPEEKGGAQKGGPTEAIRRPTQKTSSPR